MCFVAIFREVGSALVTQIENSEWRQNLRAEVAEKERDIMEKKGVIKNPGVSGARSYSSYERSYTCIYHLNWKKSKTVTPERRP